jgi:ankyrin repeat protein
LIAGTLLLPPLGGARAEPEANIRLLMAVVLQEEEQIRSALAAGADVNGRNDRGEMALHVAAAEDAPRAIRWGLTLGLPVAMSSNDGMTPLHHAVLFGKLAATRALLDAGAPIDAHEDGKNAPLHLAAVHALKEMTVLQLGRGADPDLRGYRGMTLLHQVAKKDSVLSWMFGEGEENQQRQHVARIAIVKALLAAGADRTLKNEEGLTPYEVAVKGERPEIAKLLAP